MPRSASATGMLHDGNVDAATKTICKVDGNVDAATITLTSYSGDSNTSTSLCLASPLLWKMNGTRVVC